MSGNWSPPESPGKNLYAQGRKRPQVYLMKVNSMATTTGSGTSISVLSIQIPEDAEPGDTLQFESNGQLLELVVPVGSVPGDVLEIQIGSNSTGDTPHNHNNTQNETHNVTIIDIGNGLTVEFVSQLPDDYHVQSTTGCTTSEEDYDDGKNNTRSDNHNKDNDNDGTFALPWQSGIELASHWRDISKILLEMGIHSKRRILELGSGLGVVGVSLAMTRTVRVGSDDDDHHHGSSNEQSYHPLITKEAAVILTDLPAAMPLLEFNVEQHQNKLSSPSSPSSSMLSTRPLRWKLEHEADHVDVRAFANEPPFDMIVGSDLLYNTEYIPQLIATMKRFLHPTRGIVVLAVRWRKPELERIFFKVSGLDWQLLVPKQPPDGTTHTNEWYQYCSLLSWNEFGDPSNQASNRYFHQTQISVNGQPQSLANITEEQAQGLPPEEFLAWERSFIQFYLGKPKETLLVET